MLLYLPLIIERILLLSSCEVLFTAVRIIFPENEFVLGGKRDVCMPGVTNFIRQFDREYQWLKEQVSARIAGCKLKTTG